MKKLLLTLLLLLTFASPLTANQVVYAQPVTDDTSQVEDPQNTNGQNETPTNPTGRSLEDLGFDASNVENLPTLGLEGINDPVQAIDSVLLNYIINPIFILAGGAAVIVIMYSSFRLVASRGEEEGITAAKNALIWAFAGLALVLLAYTLVRNLAEIVLRQL